MIFSNFQYSYEGSLGFELIDMFNVKIIRPTFFKNLEGIHIINVY